MSSFPEGPFATKPTTGRVASKYRLVATIGLDEVCTTYLALPPGSLTARKLIRIRELHKEKIGKSDEIEPIFEDAELSCHVRSPHVTRAEAVFSEGTRYFLATEYEESVTLREAQKLVSLTFEETVRVALDVLSALTSAHELVMHGQLMPLVHAAVSPETITLTLAGRAKLNDFGIARARATTTARATRSGRFDYVSPEIARGERGTPQADLYSLGAILWEAITGRSRWGQIPDNAVARLLEESSKAPLPGAARRGLPEALDGLCQRALAPSLADRFATAAEMFDALVDATQSLAIPETLNDVAVRLAPTIATAREQRTQIIDESVQEILTASEAEAPPVAPAGTGSADDSLITTELENDDTDDPPTLPLDRDMVEEGMAPEDELGGEFEPPNERTAVIPGAPPQPAHAVAAAESHPAEKEPSTLDAEDDDLYAEGGTLIQPLQAEQQASDQKLGAAPTEPPVGSPSTRAAAAAPLAPPQPAPGAIDALAITAAPPTEPDSPSKSAPVSSKTKLPAGVPLAAPVIAERSEGPRGPATERGIKQTIPINPLGVDAPRVRAKTEPLPTAELAAAVVSKRTLPMRPGGGSVQAAEMKSAIEATAAAVRGGSTGGGSPADPARATAELAETFAAIDIATLAPAGSSGEWRAVVPGSRPLSGPPGPLLATPSPPAGAQGLPQSPGRERAVIASQPATGPTAESDANYIQKRRRRRVIAFACMLLSVVSGAMLGVLYRTFL